MTVWNVLLSIFWFMLLFAWIWLLISILADIFRDPELSGWGKALWTLFIIVIPWLGALIYLIVRGGAMNERARAQQQRAMAAFESDTTRGAPGTASAADELAKFADLHQRGALSDAEYEVAKAKVLGTTPQPSSGHPLQTGSS
jgi:hypothetical protein